MAEAEEMILADRVAPMTGRTNRAGQDYLAPRGKTDGWRHAAVDIFARVRGALPVYSPEPGTVYFVDLEAKKGTHAGGYGPAVVGIAGKSGVFHWLAHLDVASVQVKVGDSVRIGQLIGTIVGTWKNPHVHWETRTQKYCPYNTEQPYPWTITIDPFRWLKEESKTGRSLAAGLEVGQAVPTKTLRPAGYPLTFTAKEGFFSADVDTKAAEERTKTAGAGLVIVGLGLGIAGLYYAKKKRWF
jgi:hypothetical protein